MTTHVLGIDLASASWADNGSALISFDRDAARFVSVAPGAIAWPSSPLTSGALADAIDAFARAHGVCAIALDGPAGWRDPETPPELPGVGRRAELACRTQGKTGVYPTTYPRTQRGWIEHCVEVFDALLEKPGVVLADSLDAPVPDGGYLLLECFPTSTWRASGLTPLPGKGKKPALAPFVEALSHAFALPAFSTGSHDDLQAVVCALVAAAAVRGPAQALARGVASRSVVHPDGRTRRVEGFIWDAAPLGPPVTAPIAIEPATAPAAPLTAASAYVTAGILAEVNRTRREGSMCIALSGTPGGTRDSRVRVALRIGENVYSLVVGDSHAAWHSHQSAETAADFEKLFARLADQPDARVAIDEVRTLSS